MGYYQQTLIIPKPTQRLSEKRDVYRRASSSSSDQINKNKGINSILAYFDRESFERIRR